jgi:4-amino-4-deoxy-L-arabinose transferase-like glycosyltransferase
MGATAGSGGSGGGGGILVALLLGALALRIALAVAIAPTPLAGDERDYYHRAERAVAGEPVGTLSARPPLTEWLYAACFRVFGISRGAARGANVALGFLALLPLYALARRFGGPRAGLWAVGLAGLYPELVAYSHFLWAETLYVFLATSGLAALLWHRDGPALPKVALAGALLGASALAREVGAVFPPLAALWLVHGARPRTAAGLAAAATLLVSAALVVLPWTLRVSREGGHFALLSHTTYLNLYLGNVEPSAPREDREARKRVLRRDYKALGETRAARERAAREIALARIAERLPWWPLEKLASELPHLFAPSSKTVTRLLFEREDLPRHPEWAYRFRIAAWNERGFRRAAAAGVVAAFVLVALLGSAGLALAPRPAPSGLLLLFIAAQLLPPVVSFATTRFRLASMVILTVAAGGLLAQGRGAWSGASPGRRAAAIAAAAATALLILSGVVWG